MTARSLPVALSLVLAAVTAPATGAIHAVDDRAVAVRGEAAKPLVILANDFIAAGLADDAVLTIVDPPLNGTASVLPGSPDALVYAPAAGFGGDDAIGYRVCAGGECDEAIVRIRVKPFADVRLADVATAGSHAVEVTTLPALPSARFVATPLRAPIATFDASASGDPTPWSAFDGPEGVTWDTATVPAPAAGEAVTWLYAEVRPGGEPFEVFVGVDDDGDGQPDEAELRCRSGAGAYCDAPVARVAGESLAVWWLAHNRGAASPESRRAWLLAVPAIAGDARFVATGPGHTGPAEPFDLRLGWDDDTRSIHDGPLVGFVDVKSDANTSLGHGLFRIRIEEYAESVPLALVPGTTHRISVANGIVADRMFVDVPPGATRLSVTLAADGGDFDLRLVPIGVAADPTDTTIAPAPDGAVASLDSVSGTLTVTGAELVSGRWYVVLANNEPWFGQSFDVTAEIEVTAPIVRSGSYFNPDRPGSGLFLYPAGDQWTGVWYAFLEDGTPTWYYLQAPRPGTDGIWSSPVFRSAWDGDANHLTPVGTALVTPSGDDRFQLSYRLDGVTGTQPYEAFGRGCPAGGAIDVSSTWFDEDRAGTGYSVQMFPDYEFYAAYFYDAQGVARFVAAELDRFGNQTEQLVVRQVAGDCPTCAWTGPPQRTEIGVLQRRFLLNTFDYIYTDLMYAAPVDGDWTATDYVQPLGGPGTTQGCDL